MAKILVTIVIVLLVAIGLFVGCSTLLVKIVSYVTDTRTYEVDNTEVCVRGGKMLLALYGFYDLLNETGYDTLDGTKNNFRIIDQNGHKCEFSDEYELTRKRYYKAEGERIFFECGYDMYLTFDEINDLTGMKLEMYR